MKDISTLAESEMEERILQNLVKDMRTFTTETLKGLKYRQEYMRGNLSEKDSEDNENTKTICFDKMFNLFDRMHALIDYSSFVILDDELKNTYDPSAKKRPPRKLKNNKKEK